MEPQREGGFALTMRHGLDAGSNNLCYEGGGERHETENKRRHFRNNLYSPRQIETR